MDRWTGSNRLRALAAVGPVAFAVLFAVRAVRPVFDPTLAAVAMGAAVVGGAMLLGHRWAAVAYLAFPVALFTSPAAAQFSFDVRGIDSVAWQAFAVTALVALGMGVGTVAIVLLRPSGAGVATALLLGGAALGLLGVPAVRAVEPMPDFTVGLDEAELDALPVVELVNHSYAPLALTVPAGGVYRARLENPSDLPHTVTIDELDLEVYVPARRWAVLEVAAADLPDAPLSYYCSVGDHRALGMQGVISIG